MDLPVGEKLGKAFEAKYPGIAVQIERSGSERLFQRVDQEFASNIRAADIDQQLGRRRTSSPGSGTAGWRRFVSEDMAKHFLPEYRDPDGMFASCRGSMLSSIAYNTKLVKPEDAPKSFADLLDPKWAGKMVKGHPAYSGTIMTATFQMVRELGWDYLDKLAKQRVMQVQSSTDPPKKLSLGERAVMADGNEYGIVLLKEAGQPVEPVYPTEGTPTISGRPPSSKPRRIPNAARLFQAWLHTRETQQFFMDYTAQYSVHAQVEVETRTAQAYRHQADEGGRRRRREDGGRNQDALRAVVQGVRVRLMVRRRISAVSNHEATVCRLILRDAAKTPLLRMREKSDRAENDPHQHHRRPKAKIDWTKPVLWLFAAVMIVLIVLPMSWLAVFAFTDKAGIRRCRISSRCSPIRISSIRC